ncbi:DEAD/DEAH box helicase [Shouchella clausii]|uniref:DEAD/DEAH box helicase n=1 Tax=Shouchella clausii TaxID=79880 RepID=UPI000BA62197|nr:DEAD/DEAH box helicase [Shouchella clausii]PAD91685.1 RNA helicase [Shouchella clausii]
MINHFQSANWPDAIGANLLAKGIEEPTPIQAAVIPVALAGGNIVARSQTGTGKTLAYLIPLLAKIDVSKQATQAVIVAPSQELAMQIVQVLKETTEHTTITSMPFIGGANIKRQIEKLKKGKPHIVVGTPGRLLELVRLKKIKLVTVHTCVIDEVDRFVEDEQWAEMEELGKRIGRDAQYLFVSATVPDKLEEKLALFAPAIKRIEAKGSLVPASVEHLCLWVEARNRVDVTRKLIAAENIEKGIVFVNHLQKLNETVEKLRFRKVKAVALSSESGKQEREKAIASFSANEAHILVATDVAARGLDLEGVTHIIQLEAPSDPDSYLHRAGRTGRMQRSGKVVTLFEQREHYKKEKYEKQLGIDIKAAALVRGRLVLTD